MTQSIACPNCRNWNGATEEKCWNCAAPLPASAPHMPANKLVECSDCGRQISTGCEACPHCGRFYQRLGLHRVERTGWSVTVGWGIVIGGIFIIILNFAALMLLFFLLAALGLLGAAGGAAR